MNSQVNPETFDTLKALDAQAVESVFENVVKELRAVKETVNTLTSQLHYDFKKDIQLSAEGVSNTLPLIESVKRRVESLDVPADDPQCYIDDPLHASEAEFEQIIAADDVGSVLWELEDLADNLDQFRRHTLAEVESSLNGLFAQAADLEKQLSSVGLLGEIEAILALGIDSAKKNRTTC